VRPSASGILFDGPPFYSAFPFPPSNHSRSVSLPRGVRMGRQFFPGPGFGDPFQQRVFPRAPLTHLPRPGPFWLLSLCDFCPAALLHCLLKTTLSRFFFFLGKDANSVHLLVGMEGITPGVDRGGKRMRCFSVLLNYASVGQTFLEYFGSFPLLLEPSPGSFPLIIDRCAELYSP